MRPLLHEVYTIDNNYNYVLIIIVSIFIAKRRQTMFRGEKCIILEVTTIVIYSKGVRGLVCLCLNLSMWWNEENPVYLVLFIQYVDSI